MIAEFIILSLSKIAFIYGYYLHRGFNEMIRVASGVMNTQLNEGLPFNSATANCRW